MRQSYSQYYSNSAIGFSCCVLGSPLSWSHRAGSYCPPCLSKVEMVFKVKKNLLVNTEWLLKSLIKGIQGVKKSDTANTHVPTNNFKKKNITSRIVSPTLFRGNHYPDVYFLLITYHSCFFKTRFKT